MAFFKKPRPIPAPEPPSSLTDEELRSGLEEIWERSGYLNAVKTYGIHASRYGFCSLFEKTDLEALNRTGLENLTKRWLPTYQQLCEMTEPQLPSLRMQAAHEALLAYSHALDLYEENTGDALFRYLSFRRRLVGVFADLSTLDTLCGYAPTDLDLEIFEDWFDAALADKSQRDSFACAEIAEQLDEIRPESSERLTFNLDPSTLLKPEVLVCRHPGYAYDRNSRDFYRVRPDRPVYRIPAWLLARDSWSRVDEVLDITGVQPDELETLLTLYGDDEYQTLKAALDAARLI